MDSLRDEWERVKGDQAEALMRALQELDGSRKRLTQALMEVDRAKVAMWESVDFLAEISAGDPDRRQWILNELYWFHTDIKTNVLADAFGIRGTSQVSVQAGPLTDTSFRCSKCGELIEVRSRSHMDQLLSADQQNLSCEACKEARRTQRSAETDAYWEAHQARLHELRTMPYKDYLQTPEWEERRSAALRRARYSCQLCNARDVKLHVHHRTYERRGEEYASDLITLCYSCHGRFHGKENQP